MLASKKISTALLVLAALLFSCGESNSPGGNGIINPPTPPPNPKQLTFKYIGLKDKGNVEKAWERFLTPGGAGRFWPFMHITDNYLYIPTVDGIYRKNLDILDDATWELYAAEGIAVRAFVINGDKILISTDNLSENMLMLSQDGGKTFTDSTHELFLREEGWNIVYNLVQHPEDKNTLIAQHLLYGVASTNDFGKTWKTLNDISCGYQERFVAYNPHNYENIFYGGEVGYFAGYIFGSYDSGNSWQRTFDLDNNCVHNIVFHPTDPDLILLCGEGVFAKSVDGGRKWAVTEKTMPYLYFQNIAFDTNDSSVAYSSGIMNSPDYRKIEVFRTTDTGDTWELWGKKEMDTNGIIDLAVYKDKLILYTFTEGVYYVNL